MKYYLALKMTIMVTMCKKWKMVVTNFLEDQTSVHLFTQLFHTTPTILFFYDFTYLRRRETQ